MNPPVHNDELQGNTEVLDQTAPMDETIENPLGLSDNNDAINGTMPAPGDDLAAPGLEASDMDTEENTPSQTETDPFTKRSPTDTDQSEAHDMINVYVPQPEEEPQLKPCITVIGVGGAGGNAVNNMISDNLQGVDFVVANTDAQALSFARTDRRIQLGTSTTQGLGAGAKPDVGRAAAEESVDAIAEQIQGANMVFITAGMGGGTGTGAAPVIARTAREMGILTVGVVTKPFQFEGAHRMRLSESGIEELSQYVDTLIIIPNQNLFRVANEKTTFADAFRMADNVLNAGVRSITDLMVMPGLINLDFADVRTVMSDMGRAMMGTGEAEGERRALDAAEAAIANPLLEDTCMKGAKGVLINITGGPDITLFEVDEAANRIRDEVEGEAHIIFGSCFDPEMEGKMRVSVVATGIAGAAAIAAQPNAETQTNAVSSAALQQAPQAAAARTAVQRPQPAVAQRTTATSPLAQPTPSVRPQQPAAQQDVHVLSRPAAAAPQRPQVQPQQTVASASAPARAAQPTFAAAPAVAQPQAEAPRMTAPQQPAVQPSVQPVSYQTPEQMELPQPRKAADAFIPPAPVGRSDQGPLQRIPSPPPVFHSEQPRVDEPAPMADPRMTQATQAAPRQELRPQVQAQPEPRQEHHRNTGFLKGLAARLTRDNHDTGYAADDQQNRQHPAAMQEPSLSANPNDRPAAPTNQEEDELAIPAFLRRQAN